MVNTNPHYNVHVSRRFQATPERVFDAWLDPASAGKWLFATPTGRMICVKIDACVGGHYLIVERRDGEDVEHTGEYVEIERPHRLAFTFSVKKYSNETDRVTLDITPQVNGCELTLTHTMSLASAEFARRTEQGWADILAGLARVVE